MKRLSIKSQYYIGVAIILLFCSVGASWYQYKNLQHQAMTSVYKKTEIYLATAASIRSYVKNILRPRVSGLVSSDQFVLEAMSTSYVSRQIMNNIKKSFPEFEYKRTALNPRNPINKADDFEKKMLLWFGKNPSKNQWSGLTKKNGQTYYTRMMPIQVEEQCLVCHGNPDQAPEELKKLYGTEHSYGYQVGSVVAADTIYIPIDKLQLEIKEKTSWVFIFGLLSLFTLFALFVLLFNRTVIQQLKRLLITLKDIHASETKEIEPINSGSHDEIEQIRDTFKSVAADLKITHEELKSSETKFRSLFHMSPNAVFVCDVSGKLTDLNKIGANLFEIENLTQYLVDNYFSSFFQNSEDGEKILSDILHYGSVVNFETVMVTSLGKKIDVSISATRILDDIYHFNFIEGMIRNITEEKRMNRHLAQTEKLASIGHLAAGVAHEINNPLGVILCYGDLILKNVESSPQISEDISIIIKHADECKTIVQSLLNFGRVTETNFISADLHDCLEEILAVLGNQMKKQQITVNQDYDPNIKKITFDQQQIKQVFMNLLLNSIQAMPNGGKLSITTQLNEEEKSVSISIKDTGCGIPKDKLDKIFEPFYTTKERGKGTGLGLSVSYGIIQLHNGSINLETKLGEGTLFSISLPQALINRQERLL